MKKINLFYLIEEIKDFFSLKCEMKGLDFIIEKEDKNIEFILIDGLRLKQILINIIGNAIKFTESGYIKIIISSEKANQEKSISNISISIEDTGIGIPKNQLNYIFEAFSQANNINGSVHGGTGLGLAITQKLMENMNGYVECESEEGKGTKFILSFRDVKVLKQVKDNFMFIHNYSEIVNFKKASILVIEDTCASRDLIVEYLSDFNFDISTASNGIEGIDIISSKMPDLVITDIKMPRSDGFDVLKKLRKMNYYKEIPIIAVSASVIPEFENTILEAGFDSFIKKPIKKYQLVHELKKYISYNS